MVEILELENNETGDYLELYDLNLETVINKYLGTKISEDYNIVNIKLNGGVSCIKIKEMEYFFENIKEKYKNNKKLQLEAVKQNSYVIYYIRNPSEKIKLIAVKQEGLVIKYIKNPSKKLQLIAVKQEGLAIQYIKNPTEEMKLIAVKENGYAIDDIENPTEEMQLEAVKQNERAIQYIDNPNNKVFREIINNNGIIHEVIQHRKFEDFETYIKEKIENEDFKNDKEKEEILNIQKKLDNL